MAIRDVVKLHGVGALSAMLKRLPRDAQAIVATKAVAAGADVMLAKGRAEVPIGTPGKSYRKNYSPGTLQRSLIVKPLKSNGGKTVRYAVYTGAASFTGPEFYGSFIEFGHRLGKRRGARRKKVQKISLGSILTGKGKRKKQIYQVSDNRKEVPANPFLKRAFFIGRAEAVRKIIDITRIEIIRVMRVKGGTP